MSHPVESAGLQALLARRSVSPRRLCAPGPDIAQLDTLIQAALTGPDHGALRPWRIVEFRAESRADLADAFEAEKLRRDPLATAADRKRARDHALLPPTVLAFVVSPHPRAKVPLREQWLAAGAALGNLLNAAHLTGFGAMMLSGERCFDAPLLRTLGVAEGEALAGFVSLGTVREPPPDAKRPISPAVWSCWSPRAAAARPARTAGEVGDDR